MKTLPDEVVSEAFALSRARGAELLARLGDFNVWHGDLAMMRGDEPRRGEEAVEGRHEGSTRRVFADTLVLARAIELLQPVCRAALSVAYLDRKDTASVAGELNISAEHAERLIVNCRERLLEIYESLTTDFASHEAAMPTWVAEREHAAAGSNRRRG